MPARLTLHLPTAPARELILSDGEVVVGRSAECGVVIDDDRVSRRHAVLAPGPSGWTVADLGSKNGTLVDGRPVTSGPLPAQSWLSFGGLIAHFEAVAGSAADLYEQRRRRLTTATEAKRALLDPRAGLSGLLSRVAVSMLSLTGAERGFLLLAGEGGELQVAARSGLSWDDLRAAEFSGSAGAVERALASGQAVVSADAGADAELGARASIAAGGIRALLCVPIREGGRSIGAMYADSRRPGSAFTELDLKILEELAAQAGLALAVSRLNGELSGLAERIAQEAGAPVSWQSLRAAHPNGAAP